MSNFAPEKYLADRPAQGARQQFLYCLPANSPQTGDYPAMIRRNIQDSVWRQTMARPLANPLGKIKTASNYGGKNTRRRMNRWGLDPSETLAWT